MHSAPHKTFQLLGDILSPQGPDDLFPEMSLTLYVFVVLLHRRLRPQTASVCFLSREGQPLMRLFDAYRGHCGHPRAHYLEVSRQSTYLPSLRPLPQESFDALFRQYWTTSPWEFLASLGLDAFASQLGDAVGIDPDVLHQRVAHLPSTALFRQLVHNQQFERLYEDHRTTQRRALLDYLTSVCDGALPDQLALVDVGWKGSIQDNLLSALRRAGAPCRRLSGYYVGLVGPGATDDGNRKTGVLFSCVETPSRYFRTFNESRALLEVLLAADHASVKSYAYDSAGGVRPVRGSFEEEAVITEQVRPVQQKLFNRFDHICSLLNTTGMPSEELVSMAARFHARMVFHPREAERRWFASLFHVENFGVFQRSYLAPAGIRRGVFHRLAFVAGLRRRAARIDLGFWPYLTIRERGGPVAAFFYGLVRRLQA
jgi:hypothetical protein